LDHGGDRNFKDVMTRVTDNRAHDLMRAALAMKVVLDPHFPTAAENMERKSP